MKWFSDDGYVGTVVTRLENHETTDDAVYFDGMGWDVYGQYNVYRQWWGIAG